LKVTNSTPKAESEVDKLTNQLIEGLSDGTRKKRDTVEEYNLPPPPDLDDFSSAVNANKIFFGLYHPTLGQLGVSTSTL